jgi:hypothetical protein
LGDIGTIETFPFGHKDFRRYQFFRSQYSGLTR